MSRIINGGKVEKHIIKNYTFKSLDEDEVSNYREAVSQPEEREVHQGSPEGVPPQEQPAQQSVVNQEVVENLLKKIEELSNNIVSSQMQFEKQINECNQRIEEEKRRAFEEGYQKGVQEAQAHISGAIDEKMHLLEESIKKVDKINETFEEKILAVEKELVAVALDIAKEVIQKEIKESSKEIAYALANSLMDDIKDASKVKIKVNPKDAEFLQGKFENVEIIPDSAVKEGGVVIMSDIGNIDAEVLSRFKVIKENVLKERNEE